VYRWNRVTWKRFRYFVFKHVKAKDVK
jgi:hypothetical protein